MLPDDIEPERSASGRAERPCPMPATFLKENRLLISHPSSVIQAQLDAYNAKDLEALLDTYAADAEQFALHGPLLAPGREQKLLHAAP